MKAESTSAASCLRMKCQKNRISVRFFGYFSFTLITLSTFAHQIQITPEMDLSSVRAACSCASTQTECGMFREAEATIKQAVSKVSRRLDELDKRKATDVPLKAFVSRIQDIRDRFDDNWTNAVFEIYALEAPLKDFVATNNIIKGRLDWHLNSFQWLRKEFEDGNRRDAKTNLRLLQNALEWEIEAFESLKSRENGFRAALGNLEMARERLISEQAKPLDA